MAKTSKKNSSQRKKASPVFIILLIVAIAIFAFAGYNLLKIGLRYKEASDSYKELETVFNEPETEEENEIDPEDRLPFKWDYDALLALNPDTVGWIYAENLLNYPIVRGEDNEKYLHILFDGTYNPSGTLFVDARHPQKLKGPYAIVYGHNMRDGSMFGSLYKFADESFYQEHKKMHVMIGYKHYIYNVVGAYTSSIDGFTYVDALNEEEDVTSYIQKVRENSPYLMYDGEIKKGTPVLVLSTCTADSAELYRYVVILTRDHEVFD